MAKLSHIEDVERRREQEAAAASSPDAAQSDSASQPDAKVEPVPEAQPAKAAQAPRTAAEREEDFHGIDASSPMGIGQKFLIVLAAIVTLVAIVYIANSWLHFI